MANEQFVSRYRKYGEEQPYWKAGIFKIRLPFIHYAWSIPEMVQAVFMCATCLGAISVLTEVLGVSYEVALSMVIINGFFYNLHVLLGDPVVPGWITPAIPLITAFLEDGYAIGPERTQALIAMQLILGLIFLVFGITGIGGKMVHLVPNSVKAGVLMGGGLSAIIGEISATGRYWTYPISITVGVLIAYFSWSGNTRYIANILRQKTGADLFEIELEKPYSTNYSQCLDEAKRDQRQAARPRIQSQVANIAQYETIFLGYPNWWASIPMPIATFLESYDLTGKTIAPFCSHGGGRLGQSVTAIGKLAPASNLTEGLSVHYRGGSSLSADIDQWLKANKLI